MVQPHIETDLRAGVIVTKAVRRVAERLGISGKELARILGVSAATISRFGGGRTIDPEAKEGELALLLIRVFRSLDAMVGGDETKARAWFRAPCGPLAGVPAELVGRVSGLVAVAEYLDAMRGHL
ncbi:MAG: antitoxin Xre-like helix-turn-helix domain-containing protein [bacterium]